MRQIVQLEIVEMASSVERVKVWLNNDLRGAFTVDASKGESMVEPTLVLLGYTRVKHVSEPGCTTSYTLQDLLNSKPKLYAAPLMPDLGDIELSRRWSDSLECYRLDVMFRGEKLTSVSAKMDARTLRPVLEALGYAVEDKESLPV